MSGDPGWPFDVLGLDGPSVDKRVIRKAYATRLKKIDQATDPEGFQALREAYEFALMLAEAPTEDDAQGDAPPVVIFDEATAPPPSRAELQAPLEPAPDPDPDPTPAPDPDMLAQAQAEQAHMDAVRQLAERVSTFTRGESDIERLTRILHDPLLLDPRASATAEQAIFDYLFEAINEDSFGYPGFALRNQDGQYVNASEAQGMRALLGQLDASFGWTSDQVRMQGRFWGYDQFLDAALYLGERRFSPAPAQSSGTRWALIALCALFCLTILSDLFITYTDSPSVPDSRLTTREFVAKGPAYGKDHSFLLNLGAGRDLSPETTRAVELLMTEQGFAADTWDRVSIMVARNWADRAVGRDHTWQDQTGYGDRHDGLKYLTGVFLAARYQLTRHGSYLDPVPFNLSWTPGRDMGTWRVTPEGRELPEYWLWNGGYVLAENHVPDATSFRVVYPADFIKTIRRWTGDDRRALEGALGIKAYTLDRTPAMTLFGFSRLELSAQAQAEVDLAPHHLVRTGLEDNRWPLLAAPVHYNACETIIFHPDLILIEANC